MMCPSIYDGRIKGIQIVAGYGATIQIVWIVLHACRKIVFNATHRWSGKAEGKRKGELFN